jgi:hypothetical protein
MHLYVNFEMCILPPLNSIFKNPSQLAPEFALQITLSKIQDR